MVRALIVVWIAVVAVVGGCAGSGGLRAAPAESVLSSAGEVTIPSRRCANYFLIDCTLNGRGPFTMILDTGASQTVVTPRVADVLKDDSRPANMYAEGSQGQRADVSRIVHIRELVAGGTTLKGFDAITLDLAKIQASLGSSVDGILGYPAFHDVVLSIDYPSSAVRVARGALPPADGRSVVELTSSAKPTVKVRIGSRTRTFLVDSGKAGAFSVRDFEHEPFASPPATIALGVAIGGSYTLRAARLADDIVLGDVTFKHPVVESSDASDLIGADALKGFVVMFDASHRRLRLAEPGGRAVDPGGRAVDPGGPGQDAGGERAVSFSPVRGIGVGFDFTDGSWQVQQVFPGLPAEAVGLQPGDWVVRLGGHRLRELACTRPLELFMSGESIVVTVVRERKRMEFTVPIVTLVP